MARAAARCVAPSNDPTRDVCDGLRGASLLGGCGLGRARRLPRSLAPSRVAPSLAKSCRRRSVSIRAFRVSRARRRAPPGICGWTRPLSPRRLSAPPVRCESRRCESRRCESRRSESRRSESRRSESRRSERRIGRRSHRRRIVSAPASVAGTLDRSRAKRCEPEYLARPPKHTQVSARFPSPARARRRASYSSRARDCERGAR
jgi:hypothetical protein